MYALRYGTVPIVRSTGGLKDTVTDFGDPGGFGIRFVQPAVWDACNAVARSLVLYKNSSLLQEIREYCMQLDHSWDSAAEEYLKLYKTL
jgi:starch synthase